MGFTLGGQTAINVGMLLLDCQEQGLPTDWADKANSFTCPLGCAAGTGHVLLTRDSLDKLPVNTAYDLVISSPEGSVTIKNLHIVKAINLTPTATGVKSAAYLVEIADRRRLWQMVPINKAYNLRSDAVGDATTDHFADTLNAGSLWTWATMIEDIWNQTGQLGDWAGLPLTPDGTPENWAFYGNRVLDALDMVLGRISCALRLDPTTELYSIVQIAAADAAFDQKLAQLDSGFKIWSTEPQEETISLAAANVRVHFRHEQGSYSTATGLDPWHTIDLATGIIGAQPETYVNLFENLTAQFDNSGTLQNSAALSARAAEQVADYVRTVLQTRLNNTYRGIHAGGILPGSQVKAIRWEQTAEGYKTTIARFPGLLTPGLTMTGQSPQEQFEGEYESPGTLFSDIYAVLPAIREWLLKYEGGISGAPFSLTVRTFGVGGTPLTITDVEIIEVNLGTGFTLAQNPLAPEAAQISLDFATDSQEGIVSTTTQDFAGEKHFVLDPVFIEEGIIYLSENSTAPLIDASDANGTVVLHAGPVTSAVLTLSVDAVTERLLLGGSNLSSYPPAFAVQTSSGGASATGVSGTFTNADITVTGGIVTAAASGSGGGGVDSIDGETGAITFADVDDTNVTLAISAAASVITFTMGWTGTLSHERGGLEADVSAYDGYVRIASGAASNIKINFAATTAPTAGDDSGDGYSVGSMWFDTTADQAYVCLDATVANAVWTEITQSGGGVTDHGALTGLSDDDHTQYALLTGRGDVQTLMGGTGAGNQLILDSTSHSTKGGIYIQANDWLSFDEITPPATATGSRVILYAKSDDLLYSKDDAGNETLVSGGSGGVTDHGALTGLADDDHAGHPWLAGRSGGQTLTGGTAASDQLILQSTSNATKGGIKLGTDDWLDIDQITAPSGPSVGTTRIYSSGTAVYAYPGGASPVQMNVPAAAQAAMEAATTTTSYTSPGTQQYHPSAVKGFCAWGGDTPTIKASYNVTSLTDGGAGNQTVNWNTDFSTADYGLAGITGYGAVFVQWVRSGPAAASAQIGTGTNTVAADANYVCIFAMGDQ